MTGEWPPEGKTVDHENRDDADGRWENLRLADSNEQARNKGMQTNNTTGVKGVYLQDGKWRARIRLGGVLRCLGMFDTIEAAAEARRAAEAKYFAEFAPRETGT